MTADRRLWRGLTAVAAVAAAASVAAPTGRALGEWAVLGAQSFGQELARHWIAVPGTLVIAGALVLAARATRRSILIALCLALVGLMGMGAWQGVAAGVDAWRDGPLNAAL